MIASLQGILEFRNDPYLIVSTGGVGYKVLASYEVLMSAGEAGSALKIFTYTHVKEDALELYGFSHYKDLSLFELLIGVSGIGPKTAISVFSIGGSNDITQAIIMGNVDFFKNVPRLGRKNAQKIIIDLKGKLGSATDIDLTENDILGSSEIIVALKNFGFSEAEAREALRQTQGKGDTPQEKVKHALRYLGK